MARGDDRRNGFRGLRRNASAPSQAWRRLHSRWRVESCYPPDAWHEIIEWGNAHSSERAGALPARKRREQYRHFTSAAFSMTSATCFAWTTSEAWLPATSVICAFILAANNFWASGASNLSLVLITSNVGLSRQAAMVTGASNAT